MLQNIACEKYIGLPNDLLLLNLILQGKKTAHALKQKSIGDAGFETRARDIDLFKNDVAVIRLIQCRTDVKSSTYKLGMAFQISTCTETTRNWWDNLCNMVILWLCSNFLLQLWIFQSQISKISGLSHVEYSYHAVWSQECNTCLYS